MSGLATNRRSLIAPAPPTVWNYTIKDGVNTAVGSGTGLTQDLWVQGGPYTGMSSPLRQS